MGEPEERLLTHTEGTVSTQSQSEEQSDGQAAGRVRNHREGAGSFQAKDRDRPGLPVGDAAPVSHCGCGA